MPRPSRNAPSPQILLRRATGCCSVADLGCVDGSGAYATQDGDSDMKRSVVMTAYQTPEGAPTCAVDFPSGQVCKFMRSRKFGLVDFCSCTGGDIHRANGDGYTLVQDECPVWGEGSSEAAE